MCFAKAPESTAQACEHTHMVWCVNMSCMIFLFMWAGTEWFQCLRCMTIIEMNKYEISWKVAEVFKIILIFEMQHEVKCLFFSLGALRGRRGWTSSPERTLRRRRLRRPLHQRLRRRRRQRPWPHRLRQLLVQIWVGERIWMVTMFPLFPLNDAECHVEFFGGKEPVEEAHIPRLWRCPMMSHAYFTTTSKQGSKWPSQMGHNSWNYCNWATGLPIPSLITKCCFRESLKALESQSFRNTLWLIM